MKYFLLNSDRNYKNIPHIKYWYEKMKCNPNECDWYHQLDKRTAFEVEKGNNLNFIDILSKPVFLVSDMVYELLQLYEPNLSAKELILYSKDEFGIYFMPNLKKIDCLTEESTFNFDHSVLVEGTVDIEKVGDTGIFEIDGLKKRHYVARLDIVESLLRRGARGLWIKELKCVRGGKMV